jgi:hypothetical protein
LWKRLFVLHPFLVTTTVLPPLMKRIEMAGTKEGWKALFICSSHPDGQRFSRNILEFVMNLFPATDMKEAI